MIFHLFVSGQEESYCDENIFALAQGLAICLNKTRKQIKILLKPYIYSYIGLQQTAPKSSNWLTWWIKQTIKTDKQLLCVTNGNVKLSLDYFCVFCDVLVYSHKKMKYKAHFHFHVTSCPARPSLMFMASATPWGKTDTSNYENTAQLVILVWETKYADFWFVFNCCNIWHRSVASKLRPWQAEGFFHQNKTMLTKAGTLQ